MEAIKKLVEKMSTEEGVLSMMDSMPHYPPTEDGEIMYVRASDVAGLMRVALNDGNQMFDQPKDKVG